MKAAPMNIRPSFPLMTQADIVSYFHLQMPRWLFSHGTYKTLSLEAKVAYAFLLNRFQLSRLNGWVNDAGEVFVVFTRESLAQEMQISYRKAIECFKELVAANLIWERRLGRGNANQIYLARVELDEAGARSHQCAPFGCEAARPAGTADLGPCPEDVRPAGTAPLDIPEPEFQNCGFGSPVPAGWEDPDLPVPHPSEIETKSKQKEQNDRSDAVLSVSAAQPDHRPSDSGDSDLEQILKNCELEIFSPEVAGVFRNAVERLYYSKSFTLGGATLPQDKIRSHLWELDGVILQEALGKLRANRERQVKNSTAYVMAVLLNSIWESESDLLVDPYLNSLAAGPRKGDAS